MKKFFVFPGILTFAIIIFGALFTAKITSSQNGLLGKPAPDFTVTSPEKKTISLNSYKGKVVILNFWATDCPPCRLEIPEFVRFYREFEKKGVVIIGLSVNDRNATLQEFARINRINYPIAADTKNRVSSLYGGIRWIPTTFIIDRKGIIRNKRVGGVNQQELLKMVEPYLETANKSR